MEEECEAIRQRMIDKLVDGMPQYIVAVVDKMEVI